MAGELACLALAMLATASATAQETAFHTPDQFKTEIARLDGMISARERALAAAESRLQQATERARQFTDEFAVAMHRVGALEQALADKLRAGDLALDEKAALGRLQARIVDIGRAAGPAMAAEERAAAERLRLDSDLGAVSSDRLLLLARYRAQLEPVYLKQVRLSFTDPRDEVTTEFYSAAWQSPEDDNSELLALMTDELEELNGAVAALEQSYRDAEQRFIAVSRRWQARNDDYYVQVRYIAPLTNMFLEGSDVAISAAMAGPGWPAVVIFEGGFRAAEAIYKGYPASTLPTLPAEIVAARERLATSDAPFLTVPGLSLQSNPDGTFGTALRSAEGAQLIKGGFGLGYAGLAERIAQTAVPLFREGLQSGHLSTWHTLALRLVDPKTAPETLYRNLGGLTRQEGARMTELMLWAADSKLVDGALSTLRQPSFWSNFGKGLGVGLAVTAAKEGVRQLNRDRSAELFQELATIELEWFVRQRALQTVNHLLGLAREARKGLVLAIAPELQKRDEAARERQLVVERPRRIVLSDWQWQQGPLLELGFSERLIRSGFDFGDGQRRGTTGSLTNHSAKLDSRTQEVVDGRKALRVFIDADGPWELHDGFDADPRTIARFLPDRTWEAREASPDSVHAMVFAKPELRFAGGEPERIVEGDIIELHYRATSTAVDGAWIGLVSPTVTPIEMPPHIRDTTIFARGDAVPVPVEPNGSEGTVRLTASRAGNYEVRIYDRKHLGVAVARLPICIGSRDPELAGLDDCSRIEGHWLWKWDYLKDPLPREIFLARPASDGTAAEAYEVYGPTRAADTAGPHIICQRAGTSLVCRNRLLPAPNCPGLAPAWQPFEMTIDPSGNRISGVYSATIAQNVSSCEFTALGADSKPPDFPFELTRDPDPPKPGR